MIRKRSISIYAVTLILIHRKRVRPHVGVQRASPGLSVASSTWPACCIFNKERNGREETLDLHKSSTLDTPYSLSAVPRTVLMCACRAHSWWLWLVLWGASTHDRHRYYTATHAAHRAALWSVLLPPGLRLRYPRGGSSVRRRKLLSPRTSALCSSRARMSSSGSTGQSTAPPLPLWLSATPPLWLSIALLSAEVALWLSVALPLRTSSAAAPALQLLTSAVRSTSVSDLKSSAMWSCKRANNCHGVSEDETQAAKRTQHSPQQVQPAADTVRSKHSPQQTQSAASASAGSR